MALTDLKIAAFAELIASLPVRPNATAGYTAAQVQEYFDGSPEELRTAVNGLIDALVSVIEGSSGADQIGMTGIDGLDGSTIQEIIESLKTLVDEKATDNDVVKTTTDQTIDGVKTFTESPIVPIPTSDYEVAPKKYTDDAVLAGVTPGQADQILITNDAGDAVEWVDSVTDSQVEVDDTSFENIAGSTQEAVNVSIDTALNNISSDAVDVLTDSSGTITYDGDGYKTGVTTYRLDGSLYSTSVLSGGTAPNFTTLTHTVYDTDGTTVISAEVYTLTWGANGIVSWVAS